MNDSFPKTNNYLLSPKRLHITTIEVTAGVGAGMGNKAAQDWETILSQGQGKNFGNCDELSWQLVRTIVAIGAIYRDSCHET